MYDDGTLFAFLAFWGFFAFIFFIAGIAMYILAALGLYKLATNRNIENPWLAFVPIANLYILGLLVKKVNMGTFEVPSIELVLPAGCIAVAILGGIPLIGWLLNIAYLVLGLFTLYKLYSMYRPQQAIVWIILSVILPFMGPVFIFIMRNDTPVVY
jgi:hypothetical protein